MAWEVELATTCELQGTAVRAQQQNWARGARLIAREVALVGEALGREVVLCYEAARQRGAQPRWWRGGVSEAVLVTRRQERGGGVEEPSTHNREERERGSVRVERL